MFLLTLAEKLERVRSTRQRPTRADDGSKDASPVRVVPFASDRFLVPIEGA